MIVNKKTKFYYLLTFTSDIEQYIYGFIDSEDIGDLHAFNYKGTCLRVIKFENFNDYLTDVGHYLQSGYKITNAVIFKKIMKLFKKEV